MTENRTIRVWKVSFKSAYDATGFTEIIHVSARSAAEAVKKAKSVLPGYIVAIEFIDECQA